MYIVSFFFYFNLLGILILNLNLIYWQKKLYYLFFNIKYNIYN